MSESQPNPPLFVAERVAKIYPLGETEVVALKGVDLKLFPGELVVLLGPSGSGKSTLLNIMGGLDTPSEGEVHFAEHNLTQADDAELTRYRREHVGFIFQFYNLIPSLTIAENIALTSEMKKDAFTPAQALALVGLSGFEDRFPSQLSGGEQQRVAIARAVAKKPDVLFCDEPTGALDVKTGKLVLEAILKVHRELGTLVVLITHNAAIAGLADRVIRLGGGEIRSITANAQKLSLDEVEW